MDFDTGTVQAHRFKSHAKKTFVLQAFKNLVQNARLVLQAHAHVDSMPVSEPFWEPSPNPRSARVWATGEGPQLPGHLVLLPRFLKQVMAYHLAT